MSTVIVTLRLRRIEDFFCAPGLGPLSEWVAQQCADSPSSARAIAAEGLGRLKAWAEA